MHVIPVGDPTGRIHLPAGGPPLDEGLQRDLPFRSGALLVVRTLEKFPWANDLLKPEIYTEA